MNAQEPLPNRLIKQQQEVDSCVYFHIFIFSVKNLLPPFLLRLQGDKQHLNLKLNLRMEGQMQKWYYSWPTAIDK